MILKRIAVLGASAVTMVLVGCADDGVVGPTVDAGAATTLGVQAVDASTGEPIPSATLTLTEGGSSFDQPTENVTSDATTGSAVFTVVDGNTPTEASPINAAVRATAAGFVSSNQTVEITETGAVDLEIPLISITGTQPEGVSARQVTGNSVGGQLTAQITTGAGEANNTETGDESASITIGTNVQMTDADNNPVSGAVTVTTAFYDADSTDSLESFPGGFNVAVANPNSVPTNNTGTTGTIGSDGEVSFLSGGFTSIEITDANGNQVENFNPAVPITIKINKDTVNPDTGNTVTLTAATGETLPIWSFDTGTGKWSYQGQGTVTDLDTTDDVVEVTYNTTHLTYFNLDWFRTGGKRCNADINIIDSITGTTYPNRARVRIQILDSRSRRKSSRRSIYRPTGFSGGRVVLKRLPVDNPVRLVFTDISSGDTLNSTVYPPGELCNTSNITLTAPTLTRTNLTVKTVTYCSDNSSGDEVAVPSSYVYLAKDNPRPWTRIGSGYTDTNGETVFENLVVPSAGASTPTYTFFIYDRINKQWHRDPDTNTYPRNLVFNAGTHTYTARFPQVCGGGDDETTGATGATGSTGGSGGSTGF